ncbi:MAG: aquaporin [Planctomycetes bacterium]|nr:aquaporin [Planctomycetota bacterium]
MNDDIRGCVAEAVGTFVLCFIGASAICTATATGAQPGSALLCIAVAHGLALSIAVSATMATSGGQVNPAVTIALIATGHVKTGTGIKFIISQLVGSVIAGLFVKMIFSGGGVRLAANLPSLAEAYQQCGGGTPVPAANLPIGTAIFVEAILTFLLVFSVFGTAVDPRAPKIGGFGIGLTIAFDILAGGPLTGASMNPARTFGPGLAAGIWDGHVIYWTGPILGALVAGLLYQNLLMKPAGGK